MVHSLLIHLLKPYMTMELLTVLQSFPQRSIPDREGQAPCGGLTSGPTPSLPKGHPNLSGLLHLNYSIVGLQRTIYLVPLTNIQGTQRQVTDNKMNALSFFVETEMLNRKIYVSSKV